MSNVEENETRATPAEEEPAPRTTAERHGALIITVFIVGLLGLIIAVQLLTE